MTRKQSLKALYSLLEGIDFEDMFYTVYTDILSLSDRTPHGIHHKPYTELLKSLKDDNFILKCLKSIDDSTLEQAEDADMFILNPFEDVDLVIIKLHDIAELDNSVDAMNYSSRFISPDNSKRTHMVNVIILCDMQEDLQKGNNRYVYSILGHEIIHFIFRYLDGTVFDNKFDSIFNGNTDLVEYLCDTWSFALTAMRTKYCEYRDKSLGENFVDFIDEHGRVLSSEVIEIINDVADVDYPEWLVKFVTKLESEYTGC